MSDITALYKFFNDNPNAIIATRPGGPKVVQEDDTWELWYKGTRILIDERLSVVLNAATAEDA